MGAEFLSEAQVAAFGRFRGVPSREQLERYFLLDDADRALVARRRGDQNRLGFSLQHPEPGQQAGQLVQSDHLARPLSRLVVPLARS